MEHGDAKAPFGAALLRWTGPHGYHYLHKLVPEAEGAANILEGNRPKPDYAGIPSVVFTIPPWLRWELGVKAAHDLNLKFRVNHQLTDRWCSSRRTAETHNGFKVLIEEGTRRILGAHLLGAQAEELVNLFALAIRAGLRASDLERAIFAYPSHGSDLSYML